MRQKTTKRAERRRQTRMAQALIASAASTARRRRYGGADAGLPGRRLLTAYLVELRRASRLRLKRPN